MNKIKFYGKFEKIDNKIYRTKTYICLDDEEIVTEPNEKNIIGTVFMFNPGSAKTIGSNNKNHVYGTYINLELDNTMKVLYDIFLRLQSNKKIYKKGIIEIKNLFNYSKAKLESSDWKPLIACIDKETNPIVIDKNPKFLGDFVYFAWGPTNLKTREIKEFAKNIYRQAVSQKKNILYISSNNKKEAENNVTFYHPLACTSSNYYSMIEQLFYTLQPVFNYSIKYRDCHNTVVMSSKFFNDKDNLNMYRNDIENFLKRVLSKRPIKLTIGEIKNKVMIEFIKELGYEVTVQKQSPVSLKNHNKKMIRDNNLVIFIIYQNSPNMIKFVQYAQEIATKKIEILHLA